LAQHATTQEKKKVALCSMLQRIFSWIQESSQKKKVDFLPLFLDHTTFENISRIPLFTSSTGLLSTVFDK
jgi:hypothetical protein